MSEMRISKKKKRTKEKIENSDDFSGTESSEEELDLTKECNPISHYLNDRVEMINQMFSVIKGGKLKAMLPPILKDTNVEQLKLECLDELLGMSEKRILSIIEGDQLETSSESHVSSIDEASSDSSEQSDETNRRSRVSSKNKRKLDRHKEERPVKVIKQEPVEQPVQEEGKTLLEILELEMRARAIRAMLNQDTVVDLTEGDEDDFPAIVKKEPVVTEQEKTFEDRVEKTAAKEKAVDDAAKKKKLIAQLELSNKLIKKKSYRTRQQRMESIEDDAKEQNAVEKEGPSFDVPLAEVKAEKEEEIVIEDPEDGEVSSEEENIEIVKQEKENSPEPADVQEEEENSRLVAGERITAIDDGSFVINTNVEYNEVDGEKEDTRSVEEVEIEQPPVEGEYITLEDDECTSQQSDESHPNLENMEIENNQAESGMEAENLEDLSWKSRWLKRDDVQNVVKSSKICAKAKKNFVKKKKTKLTVASLRTDDEGSDSNSMTAAFEGKVSEYEALPQTNRLERGVDGNATTDNSGDGAAADEASANQDDVATDKRTDETRESAGGEECNTGKGVSPVSSFELVDNVSEITRNEAMTVDVNEKEVDSGKVGMEQCAEKNEEGSEMTEVEKCSSLQDGNKEIELADTSTESDAELTNFLINYTSSNT